MTDTTPSDIRERLIDHIKRRLARRYPVPELTDEELRAAARAETDAALDELHARAADRPRSVQEELARRRP